MPGIRLSAGDNMVSIYVTDANEACTKLCVRIEKGAAVNFAWALKRIEQNFKRFGSCKNI